MIATNGISQRISDKVTYSSADGIKASIQEIKKMITVSQIVQIRAFGHILQSPLASQRNIILAEIRMSRRASKYRRERTSVFPRMLPQINTRRPPNPIKRPNNAPIPILIANKHKPIGRFFFSLVSAMRGIVFFSPIGYQAICFHMVTKKQNRSSKPIL